MLKRIAITMIPAVALGAALLASSNNSAEAVPMSKVKTVQSNALDSNTLVARHGHGGFRGGHRGGFRHGGFRHGGFRHGGFRHGFRHFHGGFRHFRGGFRHYWGGYRYYRGGYRYFGNGFSSGGGYWQWGV